MSHFAISNFDETSLYRLTLYTNAKWSNSLSKYHLAIDILSL